MKSLTYGIDYKRVVDGGYMTFLLGIRENMDFWEDQRFLFKDALICMDSRSHRKDIYPEYKSRRTEQRWDDERKAMNYEKVQAFRKVVEEDLTIEICKVDGAEGDDLVALMFMLDPTLDVVAVDKDLHPIPGIYQAMLRGSAKSIKPLEEKVPQYIGATLRSTPASLLILQALRGDKSDSIPRLLPSNIKAAKALWSRVYQPDDLRSLRLCYKVFGDQFLRNLSLVLMPGSALMDATPEPLDLFKMIVDLTYWNTDRWTGIIQKMLESRNPEWRVKDLWPENDQQNPRNRGPQEDLWTEETSVQFDVNDVNGYWTQ